MTTRDTAELVIRFDTSGQATIGRATDSLAALNRQISSFGGHAQSNGRVLRQLENDLNRTAQTWSNRFNAAVQVSQGLLTGFSRTLERVGRYGFYSVVAGAGAATFALAKLAREFISVNEKFAGLEITLRSSFRSAGIASQLREEIAKITTVSPIPFSDLAASVRSLSVIPYSRGRLSQQAANGNFADPQGFLRQSTRLLEQMIAFRPDKTVQDAMFSLREALGGEFRSLIRRFDIPGSYISSVAGRSLKSLRGDDSATYEALRKLFGEIITPSAIQEYTRQPKIFFANLIEQVFSIPALQTGNSGFYAKILKSTDTVFRVVSDFMDRNLVTLGQKLSDDLSGAFDKISKVIGDFVEQMLSLGGYGKADLPSKGTMERALSAFLDFITKATQLFPEVLRSLLSFIKTITPALQQVMAFVSKLAKGFLKSFIDMPVGTTVAAMAAPALYGALPAMAGQGMSWASRALSGRFSSGYAQGAMRAMGTDAGFSQLVRQPNGTIAVQAASMPSNMNLMGSWLRGGPDAMMAASMLNPFSSRAAQGNELTKFFSQGNNLGKNPTYQLRPNIAGNLQQLRADALLNNQGWIHVSDLAKGPNGITAAQLNRLNPNFITQTSLSGDAVKLRSVAGGGGAIRTAVATESLLATQAVSAFGGLSGGLSKLVGGITRFVGVVGLLALAAEGFYKLVKWRTEQQEEKAREVQADQESFGRTSKANYEDLMERSRFASGVATPSDAMYSYRGTRVRKIERNLRSGYIGDFLNWIDGDSAPQVSAFEAASVRQNVSGKTVKTRLAELQKEYARFQNLLETGQGSFDSPSFPGQTLNRDLFAKGNGTEALVTLGIHAKGSPEYNRAREAVTGMYTLIGQSLQDLTKSMLAQAIKDTPNGVLGPLTEQAATSRSEIEGLLSRSGLADVMQRLFTSSEMPGNKVRSIKESDAIAALKFRDAWIDAAETSQDSFGGYAKATQALLETFKEAKAAKAALDNLGGLDTTKWHDGAVSRLQELTDLEARLLNPTFTDAMRGRTLTGPDNQQYTTDSLLSQVGAQKAALQRYIASGSNAGGEPLPGFFAQIQRANPELQVKTGSNYGAMVDVFNKALTEGLAPVVTGAAKPDEARRLLESANAFLSKDGLLSPEKLREAQAILAGMRPVSGLSAEAGKDQTLALASNRASLLRLVSAELQPGGSIYRSVSATTGQPDLVSTQMDSGADAIARFVASLKTATEHVDEMGVALKETRRLDAFSQLLGDLQGLPSLASESPSLASKAKLDSMRRSFSTALGAGAGSPLLSGIDRMLSGLDSDTSKPWMGNERTAKFAVAALDSEAFSRQAQALSDAEPAGTLVKDQMKELADTLKRAAEAFKLLNEQATQAAREHNFDSFGRVLDSLPTLTDFTSPSVSSRAGLKKAGGVVAAMGDVPGMGPVAAQLADLFSLVQNADVDPKSTAQIIDMNERLAKSLDALAEVMTVSQEKLSKENAFYLGPRLEEGAITARALAETQREAIKAAIASTKIDPAEKRDRALERLLSEFSGIVSVTGARPTLSGRVRLGEMQSALQDSGISDQIPAGLDRAFDLLSQDTSRANQIFALIEKNTELATTFDLVGISADKLAASTADEILVRKYRDISVAARETAEELRRFNEQVQGDGMWSSFKEGLTGVTEAWRASITNFRELGASMVQGLSGQFTDLFDTFITGSKTAKEAFRDFAVSTTRMIANMLMQKAIQGMLGMAFSGLAGGATARPNFESAWNFKAAGGLITEGSGSRDDVPVMAMQGEYVLNRKAVSQVGVPYLNAVNQGRVFSHLAGGGSVGYSSPASGAGSVNISVNVAAGNPVSDPEALGRAVQIAVRNELLNQRRQNVRL